LQSEECDSATDAGDENVLPWLHFCVDYRSSGDDSSDNVKAR
jgi:hypothetical protein